MLQRAFSLSCLVLRTAALQDSVGIAGSRSPVPGKLAGQEAELPCPLQAGRRDGSGVQLPALCALPLQGTERGLHQLGQQIGGLAGATFKPRWI